ncbi:AraC family transcriptional regulator [Maricurvus nonylphenolicus]|uniref:AraC family transcriptional regulator n=1 Tax=Maricurvus nonylphenolicus TaxID=1008307 RepID=UPI0036F3C3EB
MVIQSKPMMRIDALKGIDTIIHRYGGDPDALLQEFGISTRLLASEDAYFCLDELAEFSTFIEQRLGINDLGLQLAEQQSISVLGPVALLIHHQQTVREAVDMMQRYLPYHTSGATSEVRIDETTGVVEMTYELALSEGVPRRSAAEQSFLNMVKILQLLVPPPWKGLMVDLTHQPVLPVAEYEKRFGCPVHFGQAENKMCFASELLERELQYGNSALSDLAEQHIEQLIARNPLDTARQVESLISQQLSSGHIGICQIASQLQVHERTLQRRLEKQGVYFEDIVDSVRQELARRYLSRSELSLSQIAGLLGYGDQSAFNRACKRWTKLTPKKYREALREDMQSV